MKNPFKNKNIYSGIALILVYIGEFIAFSGIQEFIIEWKGWCYNVLFVIALLWIIGLLAKMGFGFRSMILTKLLANAIVPSTLGALYLFSFVVHIGWLTNAAMCLFMPSDPLKDIVTNVVICLLGMGVLIIFFPNGKKEKNKNATKVFVSGISAINPSKRNMKPLVAPLVLANNENCKMLILFTNLYTSFSSYEELKDRIFYINNLIEYVKEDEMASNDVKEIRNRLKNFYEPFKKINDEEIERMKGIKDEETKRNIKNEYDNKFKDEFNKHKEEIDYLSETIKLYIKGIIPIITKQVLGDESPTSIDVEFTKAVDYDRFEECYLTLDKSIKRYDTEKNLLFFNLTPGTGIVGALMALISINGNRKLYYYKQNSTDKVLAEAEKSRIPLKSLLSQALENYEAESITD